MTTSILSQFTPAQLQEIANALASSGIRIGSQGKVYQTQEAKPNFFLQTSQKGNTFGVFQAKDSANKTRHTMRLFRSDRSPTGLSVSFNGPSTGKRGINPFLNILNGTEFQVLPNSVRVTLDFPLTPNLIQEVNNFLSGNIPVVPQAPAPTTVIPPTTVSPTPIVQATPQATTLTQAQMQVYQTLVAKLGHNEALATALKVA